MSRGRLMNNGDLIFPIKGAHAPKPQEGYMADAMNPWVHHKIYASCKFRSFVNTPTQCGAQRYTYYCELDQFVTTFVKCEGCTRAQEGLFLGECGLTKSLV